MISEKCRNTYTKLNTFVTKVINRDVPNKVYPIGSIYMSVNSTNPSELFGGEWERIQDRFLLASGSAYANGSTGGSATVTLTSAQSGVPAHSHKYQDYNTTYTLKTTNRKQKEHQATILLPMQVKHTRTCRHI